MDRAIPPNAPSSSGGGVTAYGVTPGLPEGLSLAPDTGILSGIPKAVSPSASYTMTATNAAGSTSFTLTLGVVAGLPQGWQTLSLLAGHPGGAGNVNGVGTLASLNRPWAVAVDGNGYGYVADWGNSAIRKISPSGVVSTLAGNVLAWGSADGAGAAAGFAGPSGVAVDGAGTVYVADTYNHTIRKITPAGDVTTLAGTAGQPGHADGMGAAASFNLPSSVAVDRQGKVYVADRGNGIIRAISPTGAVTTVAGTAGAHGSADGTGPAASFSNPNGIAVDVSGNLYVTDDGNYTVPKTHSK